MTSPAHAEPLLAEFPEHTYEQWHHAAELLLKGASFEKLLVSKTYEDITIQPIYRSEDIAGLYLVGAGTHPGAGVPGVLSSAKVLDRVVPHAVSR